MSNIFIVRNRYISGEEEFLAAFDNKDGLEGFINRNNTVKGKYEIIELTLNPPFIISPQTPYYVIINPPGEEPEIIIAPIELFADEAEAENGEVFKVDGAFYQSLYAKNAEEAELIARKRFEEIRSTTEWSNMADVNDAGI